MDLSQAKAKRCGCLIFDNPDENILCERHRKRRDRAAKREERKATKEARELKREARKAAREEKRAKGELRAVVRKQAFDQGHDLSDFKEVKSWPGKWTAHCHSCGALVIVYDAPPEYGDQIAGKALFASCKPSNLVGALSAVEENEPEAIELPDIEGEDSDGATA